MKAYKIVEVVDNNIKTLFHGIDGSRNMKKGTWIEANIKMGIDGKGQTPYKTGWHVLPTRKLAKEYMSRFKKRLDILEVVECEVKELWSKPTNKDIILSKYIKF